MCTQLTGGKGTIPPLQNLKIIASHFANLRFTMHVVFRQAQFRKVLLQMASGRIYFFSRHIVQKCIYTVITIVFTAHVHC